MGSHYIPVGKLKIDKSILDLACPAAGYGETPPPPEIYCPINGYIPDPTIPQPDELVDDFLDDPDRFIPGDVDSYQYILFLLNRDKSPNTIFKTGAPTALENVTLAWNGSVISTNANNLNSFDLNDYNESVVVIRLKFNPATNIAINASQPADMPAAGLVAVLSGIQSASFQLTNQIHLKKVKFFKPLINVTTLSFNGSASLYDIKWADASFDYLINVPSSFRACGFQKLTNIPYIPNAQNVSYFIYDNLGLEEVVLPFDLTTVTNVQYLFGNVPKLKKINGIGVGGKLVVNFDSVTGISSSGTNLFSNCGFDGDLEINLLNITSNLYRLVKECDFVRNVKIDIGDHNLTSLSATSNLIGNCPRLKKVTFSDNYKGNMQLLQYGLVGSFESLEEIVFPMNDTPGEMYSNFASFQFLQGIKFAPKLKKVSGRLGFDLQYLTFYSNTHTAAMTTLNFKEGIFPALEEIDYPELPFTTATFNYCNLKKINCKFPTNINISFLNCNIDADSFNVILNKTIPWIHHTNTFRTYVLTGNRGNLPIVKGTFTNNNMTTNVREDTLRYTKSTINMMPEIGMNAVCRFEQFVILAGNKDDDIIIQQYVYSAGTAQTQMLQDNTPFFVRGYGDNSVMDDFINKGIPVLDKLYIAESWADISNPYIYYKITDTPNGSPLTFLDDFDYNKLTICANLKVIDVYDDANYVYVVLDASFNSYRPHSYLQALCTDEIDVDALMKTNRQVTL